MKKVILLGVACVLAGCVTLNSVTTNMTTKWAGKSYDEFVLEHGVAKASQKLQNGMTMHMWEQAGRKYQATVYCTLNILVDGNNKIKSIKASGDADFCP